MFSRITLFMLATFWLTMTYLLWRSEYVGHNQVGTSIPVELVWRKILTAPDNSSLEIMHEGKKVGYCRLASNLGQDLAMGRFLSDGLPPTGSAESLRGYRLDLEGNVAFNDVPGHLRFDFEIKLDTNQVWQEFDMQIRLKPSRWQVHSRASEQSIHLLTDDGLERTSTEQVFKFSDLQNPQMLMQDFDLPAPLGLLGAMGAIPHAPGKAPVVLGLNWKARNDWITIGHTSVRAYRLEATLFDRYRMLIIVSRVGEILRVELPDDWKLVNDQLTAL